MNYDSIAEYLRESGYKVSIDALGESRRYLRVEVTIQSVTYTLLHPCIEELTELPYFFLEDSKSTKQLAHVTQLRPNGVSVICVTASDAISVNYDVPELAFEASLEIHIKTLQNAVTDPDWNALELTREFQANWDLLCNDNISEFLCATPGSEVSLLSVIPPNSKKNYGIESAYVGFPDNVDITELPPFIRRRLEDCGNRSSKNGIVIPIGKLWVPPKTPEEIRRWCGRVFSSLNADTLASVKEKIKGIRYRVFWVIFNGDTPSGRAWFGVRLSSESKKFLPLTPETLGIWDVEPIKTQVFDKEVFLPRSGAEPSLSKRKVLLVGCGSVGGEVALKLGAAGVGEIHLSDPDKLSWNNTYRHVLPTYFVGCNKAGGIALNVESQYPWVECKWNCRKLLEYRQPDELQSYDLIIIAIGSPTHERLFADYIQEKENPPAMINTWVEGFGVGGHATLSIPKHLGCLNCAYVDNSTFDKGLVSNLNFIDKNQNVTRNIAGCGDLFLPYDALAASQTALVASNLAIEYLTGRLNESSSVSWKGSDREAAKEGIQLTHRYYNYDDSLKFRPLYHEACDVCRKQV